MQLLTGETGESAAAILEQVLVRAGLAGRPRGTTDDASLTDLWERLTADRWHLLAAPASRGGGDASLVDVLAVAELWGRHLVPVPLLETQVLQRWLVEPDAAAERPLTWIAANGMVPFASHPGVSLVQSVQPLTMASPSTQTTRTVDEFAPSLPLGWASGGDIPRDCIHELEAVTVASGVGAAAAALDATVAYIKERHAFGQPVGRFQAVKHRVANMHIDVELARTAVIWAAQDRGARGAPLRVALERCQRAVAGAIQMHGGMGFTWDMGIHFYMRHVLAISKLIGPRGSHRNGPVADQETE